MKLALFLLASAALALASPHLHAVRRHSIPARAALPIPADVVLHRRQPLKRCKERPSSSGKVLPVKTPSASNPPLDVPTSTTPLPTSTTPTPPTAANPAQHTGQGTYYGTGLGACGFTSTEDESIVAVSHHFYDTYPGYNNKGNPNTNPLCGKFITASRYGKSVTVKVVDRCEGCYPDDLDFSLIAFTQIAREEEGRVDDVTWNGP